MADTSRPSAPATEEEERNPAEETVTLLPSTVQTSSFEQEAPAVSGNFPQLDEGKGNRLLYSTFFSL